jgi:hypothetical protein
MCTTVLILPGGSCQVTSLAKVEVAQNHPIWKHLRPPLLQHNAAHHTSTRLDLTRPTRRYNPSGPSWSRPLSWTCVFFVVNLRLKICVRQTCHIDCLRYTTTSCIALYRAATAHLSMPRPVGRGRYNQIAAASPVDPLDEPPPFHHGARPPVALLCRTQAYPGLVSCLPRTTTTRRCVSSTRHPYFDAPYSLNSIDKHPSCRPPHGPYLHRCSALLCSAALPSRPLPKAAGKLVTLIGSRQTL